MKHNLVKWKPVMCKARDGTMVALEIPEIVDVRYRGTLLARILAMPKGKKMAFDEAIRLLSDRQAKAISSKKFGDEPGHYGWYDLFFLEWISAMGFHIELTGDEFETPATRETSH